MKDFEDDDWKSAFLKPKRTLPDIVMPNFFPIKDDYSIASFKPIIIDEPKLVSPHIIPTMPLIQTKEFHDSSYDECMLYKKKLDLKAADLYLATLEQTGLRNGSPIHPDYRRNQLDIIEEEISSLKRKLYNK